MDIPSPLPDWSLIQSFLEVADGGSLSAAARATGRSQPSLGRDIRLLETQLGATLFDRHARGLRLSETGARLLPHAEQMRRSMQALSLTAAGERQDLAGTVRITASVFAAHYVLPTVLAAMRQAEPAIQIELIPSDDSENLLFRAADIAVRMYRPTHPELIARPVAEVPMGVFAARNYLERAGRPHRAEDLRRHAVVGFDRNPLILDAMRALGQPVDRDFFALRCDNQATYWELVRAGCGIGFTQAPVGRADPLVEELELGIDLPRLPVWLTAPELMRRSPRIARSWELLHDGLRRVLTR
ncbi:LysR family transcriptional regulator [Pseudodonghicola flavimaris]|uniref:LysR family transcriptional regulator n=1 Tax=Pseudodonghicola flavimaris TaxID=3050036 RepID=A0ABT7EWG7_9RHOB|nr:LysR family transcriptional regulator [Pseudodonghicola flavimaris]MDK3016684.1 LysR family transcriptional regulator [Pseudodonghicola flavimaris]